MVFNATFNNILVISWRSVLLAEETVVPGENHPSVIDKLYGIMLYRVHLKKAKLKLSHQTSLRTFQKSYRDRLFIILAVRQL